MRCRITFTLALLFAISAVDARAQVAIGAAVGQSHQAAGSSDSPYLGPGFSGTALAGTGMIDVAIDPRATVGGEISTAADITGAQRQRTAGGTNAFVASHRDTVFSAVVKVGTPQDRRVRASAVGGGGIAQRRTDRDGTFVPFNPASPSSSFHASLSDYVLAFTGGVDIAVGLTRRAALVAVGRLYQLKDDDRDSSGVVHRGVSSTVVRYGGGLQLRF